MKKQVLFFSLSAFALLLVLGQAAQAMEIPFVISYYDNGFKSVRVDPTGYSTLAAAGFNVVNSSAGGPMADGTYIDYMEPGWDPNNPKGNALGLAAQYGMRSMVDFNPTNTTNAPPTDPSDPEYFDVDARVAYVTAKYGSNPTLLGYRLRDEPSADEWTSIASISNKLLNAQQAAYGNTDILPWVNILPNYSYGGYGTGVSSHKQYIESYIATVQPKVLCYDEYTSAYNSTYPEDVFAAYMTYSNLETFREYSQANNIPFWRIIESNLGVPFGFSPNTEGIYRQQVYTSLAYGAKGILYFTYTQQDGTQALAYYKHQIGEWGTPTNTGRYQSAQTINAEVQTLAPLLMTLTSTKVCHTDPGMSPDRYVHPDDRQYFNGLGSSNFVNSISGGEALLGEFEDPTGRDYLMFVNKDYVNAHNLTIQFNAANVPAIGKVNKGNGRVYPKSMSGGAITKYFDAGDGHLYKVLYDTSAASTPTNLNTVYEDYTRAAIDWSNSTDPQSGVDYYVVYRNGVEIDTVTSSFYLDMDLMSGTDYSYMVSAVNGEGIESGFSSLTWVSTLILPGDANNDGVVDDADATLLAANWLTESGATWAQGDFNDDGAVNEKDASILAANWGNTASSMSSVPEPGMLALLAGILLAVTGKNARLRRSSW